MGIHDSEFDTSRPVVLELLRAAMPAFADSPMELLANSGTSNALWRVGLDDEPDLIVRLPRTESAARSISVEASLLPQLGPLAVGVPEIAHVGEATDEFPHPWLVTRWIDGWDAWSARTEAADDVDLAVALARVVGEIRALDVAAARVRGHGDRGGSIGGLLDRLDRWLIDPTAAALFDTVLVRALVDEARELVDERFDRGFQHGDLIPGNLLVDAGGRLAAVIDWGSAAIADVAQDLTPAWSLFDEGARDAFLGALDVDGPMRIRARTIALEQAVGAVLYYEPRRHLLGTVMRRTLDRILTEG